MPRYRYKAYDAAGAIKSGSLTVEDRQSALQALARKSEVAIELEEAGAGPETAWWQRDITLSRRLSGRALADFLRDLSGLVSANLPIDDALRIIAEQPTVKPAVRAVTADLLERVTSGASLAEAMAAADGVFPPFVIRLVGAGEISGSLDSVLVDLSRHLEQASARASKVATQLLYPAILVIAAAIALTVVTLVLVPAVRPLFDDAGAPPPAIIAALSWVADFVSGHGALLFGSIFAIIWALFIFQRSESGRLARDRILLETPVLGTVLRQSETARLSRSLAALIRNGVPLTEALGIVAGVLTNTALGATVAKIQREVEEGRRLSAEFQRSAAFPALLPRLIQVGEETGQLEGMLVKVAEVYERSVENRLERLLSLLTPVLIALIGGFVGFLVISVMNAILSANALVVQ